MFTSWSCFWAGELIWWPGKKTFQVELSFRFNTRAKIMKSLILNWFIGGFTSCSIYCSGVSTLQGVNQSTKTIAPLQCIVTNDADYDELQWWHNKDNADGSHQRGHQGDSLLHCAASTAQIAIVNFCLQVAGFSNPSQFQPSVHQDVNVMIVDDWDQDNQRSWI